MATTYEPMTAVAAFRFDNSFARELQGFYVSQQPAVVRAPRLLFLNDSLAAELGLDLNSLDAGARAALSPEMYRPTAQNRWLRPTQATSSADSHLNSGTAARFFLAR